MCFSIFTCWSLIYWVSWGRSGKAVEIWRAFGKVKWLGENDLELFSHLQVFTSKSPY